MAWTTSEIEEIVMKRPRLAVALLQILVQRTHRFHAPHREFFGRQHRPPAGALADPLLRAAGYRGDDGSVRMSPFTHELLSQYVGTSREIVTHYMNQFRRMGYLRYSRRGIVLYRDAFQQWLRNPQLRVRAGRLGRSEAAGL